MMNLKEKLPYITLMKIPTFIQDKKFIEVMFSILFSPTRNLY